mgnify:FL=1|jgi:DNA-entry nuclease
MWVFFINSAKNLEDSKFHDIILGKWSEHMKKNKTNISKLLLTLAIALFLGIATYFNIDLEGLLNSSNAYNKINYTASFDLTTIPKFENEPYVVLNDNKPDFNEKDFARDTFEDYSPLDYLGRCGPAFAKVGIETMPTEERGAINSVKPSGWQTAKYDIVEGKYLYNRCHLIGYQLTAENANEKNLITGTRYMNVQGMLPFENMVAEYVRTTKNHVLYRVTPIFENDNLVANGVEIEAQSVEDKGEGICFNVYVYNVQPGIDINYKNGESTLN